MNVPLPVSREKTTGSLLLDPDGFEHIQRAGKMLAMSAMFPDHLKDPRDNQVTVANGVLVLEMAHRMGRHPLMIAQSIYFVSGKPGWDAKFMIAMANESGVFKGRIKWDVTEDAKRGLTVVAYATLRETNERVDAKVDMAMAKAENWTKNAKYQSMPEQMLKYRSAVFLIRLNCPEVMLGMRTQDELEDIVAAEKDITPPEATPEPLAPEPGPEPEAEDAEVVEEAPKAKGKPTGIKPKAKANEKLETAEEVGEAPAQDEPGDEITKEQSQAMADTVRIVSDLQAVDDHEMIEATMDMNVGKMPLIEQFYPEGLAEIEEAREAAEARANGDNGEG